MQQERGGFVVALIVVVLVIAVIAGGVVFYLFKQINPMVKDGIETYGSQMTGTKVEVEKVDISLAKGRGTFNGLTIANPEGFSGGKAFTLGTITLDIDVKSVTKVPIVIDEVLVDSPKVLFEVNGKLDKNIEIIQKNVERAIKQTFDTSESKAEKRFIIRKFTFRNGQIEADASAMGVKKQTVEIPPVNLTDLGGSSGATAEEIGKKVMVAFSKEVMILVTRKVLEGALKDKLQGDIQSKLEEKLGTGAKNLLKGLFK